MAVKHFKRPKSTAEKILDALEKTEKDKLRRLVKVLIAKGIITEEDIK